MRALLAAAVAITALALCLMSLLAAATGEVDLGIAADNPGGRVQAVTVGGPAWEAGIRAGQRVVAVAAATDPGGWSIETTDGSTTYRLSGASADADVRASGALAVAGLALALLALRDARSRARRSEALSVLALVLAAGPSLVLDQGLVSRLSVVLGGCAPALWLAGWAPLPRRARLAAVGVASVGAVAGLAGLGVAGSAGAPGLLALWAVLAVAGASAVAWGAAGMTTSRAVAALASITLLDASLACLLVLAVVGLSAEGVALPWLAAGAALAAVAYARSRRALRAVLDRVLLADLRERAAIRATEDERSRLAREIHDDPLQGIAGVIRQLEGPDPDAETARESLRGVATRLRSVATELHPPVLDDLGLVPAIEAAARTAGASVEAVVEVDDRTDYTGAGRPPEQVELAVFRIVQEAVNNAARHGGGRHVWVRGVVAPGLVELAVLDDGSGFGAARAEAALREGRIGLASMRQRAASIGARLEFGRSPAGGASIAVRWRA